MTDLPIYENPLIEETEDQAQDLQRTEEWFADRLGMFTGSKFKALMTCRSKAKGKDWLTHKWLFDFGDTALSCIAERAIERATGQRIETPTTWEMTWGTQHEPEGTAFFEKETGLKVEPVGFTKFLKNAGASPDGVINSPEAGRSAFELKCPPTVKSHRNLMLSQVVEGHDYFWQIQGEMIALDVRSCEFATYNPLYPERAKLGRRLVLRSETHELALKFRLIVAEMLANRIIELNFLCDDRALLQEIADSVPTDWDGLEAWYRENLKDLQL